MSTGPTMTGMATEFPTRSNLALYHDFVAPFDHDNDGTRDDIDEDDDQDGMHDIDEVMLWPE